MACASHAAELSKQSFTGIQWGSQVTVPDNVTERPHWLVERKDDGTVRSQGVTVDHRKKLYFLGAVGVGTWSFKDGVLSHLFNNGLKWKATTIHQDGKALRWEQKRKSGWDAVLEKNSEESVGTFSVPLGRDYRQVTEKEFHDRNRRENHREPSPLEVDPVANP
jgi:hypothetical protein